MVNKLLKFFQSFFLAIFMVSFSITVVILFRPYYYLNINLLNLEKETGYSYEVIKEAYDDIMDYLVFNDEFKTGQLIYSEDGKSHFEDCKRLFSFNFICLFVSLAYLITTYILKRYNKITLIYKKFSPSVYSLIGICSVIFILLIWGTIDFYSLFFAFHKIAFPGKTNWGFDEKTDPIVNILPTKLWINFSILIVFILAIFVTVLIAYESYKKEKEIELKKSQE